MTHLRIALVGPTHDRPDLFAGAVAAIRPQVDFVITVTHGDNARAYAEPLVDDLIEWPEALPNISAMWNAGLDLAEAIADGDPFDVAVLNDDTIPDPTWYATMATAMHAAGAAGASGSRQANKLATMAGYAYLLDGTKGVRADETLRWWFSDDGIQQRCNAAGGVVIINGVGAANLRADTAIKANPKLAEMSREDREVFRQTYREFVLPSNVHRGKGRVPLVISAPSGEMPVHLLEAAGNRPTLVLTTTEWEDQHLRYAADTFDWFVFLKESTRILNPQAFWATIDAQQQPAWLFAWPSCYMGLFARAPMQKALRQVRVRDKWGSISEEARLAQRLNMRNAIWPEISDANALRIEGDELIIGNTIIEKSKGSAWCGHCPYEPPGICDHVRAAVGIPA